MSRNESRRFFFLCGAVLPVLLWLTSCSSMKEGGGPQLEVVPRSAWAPLPSAVPKNAVPMVPVTRITVHHDGIDPPTKLKTHEQIQARLQSIRGYHLSRGWADIGYHFIIDPMGRVWKGRPLSLQGAHVSGDNEGNIGIMVLGNFEIEHPSEPALDALSILIRQLKSLYQIPDYRVYTHQELGAGTECPGSHLQAAIDQVR